MLFLHYMIRQSISKLPEEHPSLPAKHIDLVYSTKFAYREILFPKGLMPHFEAVWVATTQWLSNLKLFPFRQSYTHVIIFRKGCSFHFTVPKLKIFAQFISWIMLRGWTWRRLDSFRILFTSSLFHVFNIFKYFRINSGVLGFWGCELWIMVIFFKSRGFKLFIYF